MKALSVVVPCYNSENYMKHCLDSLLVGGTDIEIIIVNDGSTDQTATIAQQYQERFSTVIKVIHQENGGHGMAVTSGIQQATGRYIKIVDSDDWVDAEALHSVLTFINNQSEMHEVDLIINNYVYEKVGARYKKRIHYASALPVNREFSWDEVKLPVGKYLLLHALIYHRSVLQKSKLTLPKHTFYVDNLYAFEPLPFVKKMYYLDVDLYRYFIGRNDQSVNEQVMIARIDQQLFVNRRMIDFYTNLPEIDNDQRNYMRQYLEIITTVSSVLLIKEGSVENLAKKATLWKYIAEQNHPLYRELRKSLIGYSVNLPGKTGRYTVIGVYRVLQKIYGFN